MGYHGDEIKSPLSRSTSILLIGIALMAAITPALGEDPPPTKVEWTLPGGILSVELPATWEANPRVALANRTTGFLHPTGMKLGQEIPVWIVVEHRLLENSTFEDFVAQCLEEGVSRGFSIEEKTTAATADGRKLLTYRFNLSQEGEPRRLSFLASPEGVILLRQQAADPATWSAAEETVTAILGSIRFTNEEADE